MQVIQFLKKMAGRTTRAVQTILLPVLLALLYVVGFGLFAIAGRWFEKRMINKTRLNENSDWHFPQYGDLKSGLERQS